MKSSESASLESDASTNSPVTRLRRRAQGAAKMVPRAHAPSPTSYVSGEDSDYFNQDARKSLISEPRDNSSHQVVVKLKKVKDSDIRLTDVEDRGGGSSQRSPMLSESDFSEDFTLEVSLNGNSMATDHSRENNDDRSELLLGRKKRVKRTSLSENMPEETSCTLALQITFPFLMAGMGMVAAGLILDKVQHWEVFEKVSEVFILVPALLGLKGNLEMTLASRLSTVAHLGYLDDPRKRWTIISGNMILVEAQAMVVAFVASLVAMTLGWIPDGKWETNHALILCAGSLLTGAVASGVLGGIMILVIVISRKCGVNPDNVATPIAASLGDLTTLSLLSGIAQGLYTLLLRPELVWIVWTIICVFIVLTPILTFFAYRNEYTRDVIENGWFPILAAMGISSLGGFILDFAVSTNPGVAVFAPVINGVGGNFVAVQASRLSTYLHKSKYPLGTLPPTKSCDCVTPCFLYCGKGNPHSRGAKVMTFMVIPGQLVFLLTIQLMQAGHTTISPQFVAVYLAVSVIQVVILLFVCHSMVHRLWRSKQDPDNCAIPYLTALGDLLGTGLLALGFLFLWTIGDRDQDVGD